MRKEVFTVSTILLNEYGYNNLSFGVPCVISKQGIEKIIELDLTQDEKQELENSSKTVLNSINILKG